MLQISICFEDLSFGACLVSFEDTRSPIFPPRQLRALTGGRVSALVAVPSDHSHGPRRADFTLSSALSPFAAASKLGRYTAIHRQPVVDSSVRYFSIDELHTYGSSYPSQYGSEAALRCTNPTTAPSAIYEIFLCTFFTMDKACRIEKTENRLGQTNSTMHSSNQ